MKIRLDLLLLQKGIFTSREKARAAIMTGKVSVNRSTVYKSGTMVDPAADIEVKDDQMPFVSRGGLKLQRALTEFNINLSCQVVLDVGSSTGGFTDCALQNRAARVIAIDVGYGQLAWSLRQDPRVKLFERTNIRYLTREQLGELADIAVIDVSFISLALVLPAVRELLREDGAVIALIKPQFEAGREKVGKRGVVREPETHREVIKKVAQAGADSGFIFKSLTYSPIMGPEGNIEYLIYFRKYITGQNVTDERLTDIDEMIERTVTQAHENLKRV